ncbi:hypothetical protein HC766_01225 [Candidatus Gracilibacteria bacterium]|nr:hypothetical protein [Candidatus Gracilibacteria bacterium]
MTTDLYPQQNNPNIPDVLTPTISNSSEVINSGFLSLSLDSMISYLNVFTLAWCIFYSVFYICDFYFYLIKYPDRELGRMKKGAKSFQNAFYIWVGYLICLGGFALYIISKNTSFANFVGVITILIYCIKILIIDIQRIYYVGEPIFKIYSQIGKFFSDTFDSLFQPAPKDKDKKFK